MPDIVLNNISKAYGEKTVLKDFSLPCFSMLERIFFSNCSKNKGTSAITVGRYFFKFLVICLIESLMQIVAPYIIGARIPADIS